MVIVTQIFPASTEFFGFIWESYTIVLEYFPMGSLKERYCQQPPLTAIQKRDIARDVAAAMQFLHSRKTICRRPTRGMLHCRLNSSNILLTAADAQSTYTRAKITDLGFNSLFTCTIQEDMDPYISPEFKNLRRYTKESDIFSFGIVLYGLIRDYEPTIQSISSLSETKHSTASNASYWHDLTGRCISHDVSKRPSFEIIVAVLQNESAATSKATNNHLNFSSKLKSLISSKRKLSIITLILLIIVCACAAAVIGIRLTAANSNTSTLNIILASTTSTTATISFTTTSSALLTPSLATPTPASPMIISGFGGVNSFYLWSVNEDAQNEIISQMTAAQIKIVRIGITQVISSNDTLVDSVPDLEPKILGEFNTTILDRVDLLMLKTMNAGIKLIISPHDRYSLGCPRYDAYASTLHLNNCTSSGDFVLSDATQFYWNSSIINAYDQRLRTILSHRNPYIGNRSWGNLTEVIFAIDVQNGQQFGNSVFSTRWICSRATLIRSQLSHGILVATSAKFSDVSSGSTDSAGYTCADVDIIAIEGVTKSTQLTQALALGTQFGKLILAQSICSSYPSVRSFDLFPFLNFCNGVAKIPWIISDVLPNVVKTALISNYLYSPSGKSSSESCIFDPSSDPSTWSTVSHAAADALIGSVTSFTPVGTQTTGGICFTDMQCVSGKCVAIGNNSPTCR